MFKISTLLYRSGTISNSGQCDKYDIAAILIFSNIETNKCTNAYEKRLAVK